MHVTRPSLHVGTEPWPATAFLLAGVLLAIGTLGAGLQWFTSPPGNLTSWLGGAAILGMVVFSLGLFGLYPRLAARSRQLARVGIVLVALSMCLLLIVILPVDVPFADGVFLVIIAGYALGVTALATAGIGGSSTPRGTGPALQVFALPWFAFLGVSLLNGFPIPTWQTFLGTATMAVGAVWLAYMLKPW